MAPQREGALENCWVLGKVLKSPGFAVFLGWKEGKGSFWPEMRHWENGLSFSPCVASRWRGILDSAWLPKDLAMTTKLRKDTRVGPRVTGASGVT